VVARSAVTDAAELLVELHELRSELAAVEGLVDQLGWELLPALAAVELVGSPGLVRELLSGALTNAAEKAADGCAAYERGHGDLRSLQDAINRLVELRELFTRFELRNGDGS
jgi:hypothetical protein